MSRIGLQFVHKEIIKERKSQSELDSIKGIGKILKNRLLKEFKSIKHKISSY